MASTVGARAGVMTGGLLAVNCGQLFTVDRHRAWSAVLAAGMATGFLLSYPTQGLECIVWDSVALCPVRQQVRNHFGGRSATERVVRGSLRSGALTAGRTATATAE